MILPIWMIQSFALTLNVTTDFPDMHEFLEVPHASVSMNSPSRSLWPGARIVAGSQRTSAEQARAIRLANFWGKTMKKMAMLGGLLAVASGCVSSEGPGNGRFMSNAFEGGVPDTGIRQGVSSGGPVVPGAVGPWGAPMQVAAPYSNTAPRGEAAARAMIASSQPLDIVQQTKFGRDSTGGISQVGYRQGNLNGGLVPGAMVPGSMALSPPGVPAGPGMPGMAPPPGIMMASGHRPLPVPGQMGGMPGLQPGQVVPGAGQLQSMPGGMMGGPGVVAAAGALPAYGSPMPFPASRTQVFFNEMSGMKVSWFATDADGKPGFTPQAITSPGRYNFAQGSIYRLKVSEVPNSPGLDLYPTLEVVPANSKTATFLAHSSVPVSITQEDLQQVTAGNFVVKVIYLPDPQFQDLAVAGGPDELVSSRLEPGVDPIAEAQRRGSILLIVRLGKIDLELAHSPAMDSQPAQTSAMMGGGMPGGMPGGRPFMTPYGYPGVPMGGMPGGPMGPGMPAGGMPPANFVPPGASLPSPAAGPTGPMAPGAGAAPGNAPILPKPPASVLPAR